MGWFDNDKEAPTAASVSPTVSPRTEQPPAERASATGSTLGANLQVNGTIVAEEPLTVHGRIEGTIHAHQGLVIARDAQLKAVVNGTRIKLEGKLTGDINAVEALVLGPTAQLHGNISTPSLQIQEGAVFRGSVAMKEAQPEAAAPSSAKPDRKEGAAKQPSAPSAGPAGKAKPQTPAGGGGGPVGRTAVTTDKAAEARPAKPETVSTRGEGR